MSEEDSRSSVKPFTGRVTRTIRILASMDITVPYSLTPHKNKYLLTFICHFARYPQASPIPDISAETCSRVYTFQIVSRHGTG